ncbi:MULTISPECIES: hypothetical protein [Streptomyces]|uniref:Uncharacterized protein n=2 Tax=root TaxID=1 RepID=F2R679_STRVP|nr:hypothetical protein [Streptomyces venezuelae]YP_010754252.1 hypothetical protein QEH31_gp40 [Streptomyces phage Chymera]AMS01599.1 hypothetical protein SEA_CHYMERA_40 [Streptomyces phage Chymera]APE22017.1 hypothetical protein vnz_13980 [Streptomyces venezuelae]QER99408.1 hypothetical protein DEJ43_14160 [Streptomyces venezuelae ATCC 10712]CCA56130.1 hypothetical protein SVEN_2844 [Streptomyces venezuelae ATCC 10712]
MTGPEHYREAERLLGMAHHWTYGDGADPVVGAALAAEARGHATLALAAAQLTPAASSGAVTVFRVAYEHSPFPVGLYANAEAARAHCEDLVSDEHPADVALLFVWASVDEDEPESVCELTVRIGDEETPTGYTVTAVVAEASYDPEADA